MTPFLTETLTSGGIVEPEYVVFEYDEHTKCLSYTVNGKAYLFGSVVVRSSYFTLCRRLRLASMRTKSSTVSFLSRHKTTLKHALFALGHANYAA